MINIENLSKSYGGRTLFDKISFKVNSKERIGLVGRNGHGKTTLFRIITGKEEFDSGTFFKPKNYRIGYVRQRLDFSQDTVLKEGMQGLMETERDQHWKVEKILAGLGFSQSDLKRSPHEFSGGFQVRLNLAKALVGEPDLLLLDEPTNYLDITSIRWVKQFLCTWPHELMLITHDRSFMDKVVTHVLGLHRKKIRKIFGNTEKYYAQIALDEEVYEKTRINDERRQKEIELFISRFRAKARLANMVQSRVKTLAKLEKKDQLSKTENLEFFFQSTPFQGKQVLSADSISFSYEKGNPLIKNFSVSIATGDRVCVVGKNGKGKTTLLKLLAGRLNPAKGKLTCNPRVVKGFFEQTNIKSLVDDRTVLEEILYSHTDVDRQKARNICGSMMFSGNAAEKKIKVLSGGEKCRVMLGKLLVTKACLLLLDEPTNHLDMESCDSLLAALDAFKGTIIMVTHNEMFLNVLAERLIIFKDDKIEAFEGSYQRFLEKIGWEEKESFADNLKKETPQNILKSSLNKKEIRRKKSAIIAQKSKALKPVEAAISKTEEKIEFNENLLATLNQELIKASNANDGPEIGEIGRKIHQCRADIDHDFDELETLFEKKEQEELIFKRKINSNKIKRNAPCPCGSGKKYKKCCGAN